MLCVNHGEINPTTNHPDSACGVYYTPKDTDPCKYHPGYVKNNSWTCCEREKVSIEGCTESTHATSDFPDDKAKLYFYPKALNNPGLRNSVGKITVGQQVARCDFFKEIKPYDNPSTKYELLKFKREKEKDEPR
jgi:hypothetical protein